MSKVYIIPDDGGLMSVYNRVMAYTKAMYRTYPKPAYRKELPTLTDEMRSEMRYNEELARQSASEYNVCDGHVYDASGSDLGPVGKVVV